ncbi:extracellular solute-binding protein [Lichenihabitans sp. Uapishka_5]|uniref:extracellular solute-binding protein n=1 Tax=Lichenihabitans sp. Uapishka_5 TaxID=3037302 RepID=UPI0029E8071F|nr:extracellular solute-binding protein [Lichenihabitans sp. Uapishka_5]MDX7951174.1 extracellular solute-binding protein [Lichenihabitans sp. Uapishka_5]
MKHLTRVAASALAMLALATSAEAKTQVVWWDFLAGGDGVRMKGLIQAFEKDNPDIEIQATTLEWGVPFYTKVQTSAAIGQGPDIMTYHLSRLPLGVSTGTLRPFSDEELKSVGLGQSDYFGSDWDAAHVDGKLYAVPLDIHSIILYYNKDLLKKAGLLGDDGKPKGLDGLTNFNAAIKKLSGANGAQYGLSIHNGLPDGGSVWRIFYTLLNQQGGTFMSGDKVLDGDNLGKAETALGTMADWVAQGWSPKNTTYASSIALFTSGKAAMHINGVWEVPTMIDLAKSNKLGFEWGAIQIPTLFAHQATWADSHAFAVPARKGNEISPEKMKAVMTIASWIDKHSLAWAEAGHIPAYRPVTESPAFEGMKPNADYATLAKTAVFDPKSTVAGVASPAYEAATNFMEPAVNGQLDSKSAIAQTRDEIQNALQ